MLPVGLEGQESVWQLVASDTDDPIQPLSYRLVDGPAGLTVGDNGLVRWRPTEDQGPSTNRLQVAVSDGLVSVTNLLEIQVIEANQPPAWSGQATLTLDEGALFERSGLATDADRPAQTLTYTLVSGPVGLSLSGAGLMQWRPLEAQGPSTNLVRITVTDGLEVVARDYTLVVREVNQAPVWDAEPARVTPEGSPYQFRLGATDLDLPVQTLAYRLLSGPSGLSLERQRPCAVVADRSAGAQHQRGRSGGERWNPFGHQSGASSGARNQRRPRVVRWDLGPIHGGSGFGAPASGVGY